MNYGENNPRDNAPQSPSPQPQAPHSPVPPAQVTQPQATQQAPSAPTPQQAPRPQAMQRPPVYRHYPQPGIFPPANSAGAAPGTMAQPMKQKKRWSTPALAVMLLAGAVAASATTAVVMDATGTVGSSRNVTTSFDSAASRGRTDQVAQSNVTPGSTEDIAARVLPSVVSIQTRTQRGGGEGSGSIFSSDGMIVTNNHVVADVANGGDIQVRLNDGRMLPASVVATDPQTDIAVIKAQGVSDLKPIALGDSDALKVGEDVVAIGSPLGLSSTVTTGIVSAKNRPVQAAGENGGEASLIDAIQTDAAINPGNSGGVLVNMEGQLVGIPSVIATLGGSSGQSGSIGLGFAIPINQAQRIAKSLIDTGKAEHPIIGAQVNTRSQRFGAEIADVSDGSPAQKAGLKQGDVVTHVDDRLVESGVGLIAAIRSHSVGDTVKLVVTDGDGGNEHTIDVKLVSE